jgi:hypothetical protein
MQKHKKLLPQMPPRFGKGRKAKAVKLLQQLVIISNTAGFRRVGEPGS